MDGHINVLNVVDVPESDFSRESINFSCYILKEMSEWLMDSGCSKHVMSHIADFIEYSPSTTLEKMKSHIRRSLIYSEWAQLRSAKK